MIQNIMCVYVYIYNRDKERERERERFARSHLIVCVFLLICCYVLVVM